MDQNLLRTPAKTKGTRPRWIPLLCGLIALAASWLLASTGSAEELPFSPKAHVITGAQDVPLVVQEWGNPDGIPVILIHGYAFGASVFEAQTGAIEHDLRLIAPDLRGHGLSGKPWKEEAYNTTKVWADDVAAIMKALDIERPILVGWSFGGTVIMHYLRHYGLDDVAGVVLSGSLGGLTALPPPPNLADYNLPPFQGDGRVDSYGPLLANIDWVVRIVTNDPAPPALHEKKKMIVAMMPPYAKRATKNLPRDSEDLIDSLHLPMLFILGDRDVIVPASYVEKLVGLLPNATLKLYSGVGHSAFEERPEQFNEDILRFARRYRAVP